VPLKFRTVPGLLSTLVKYRQYYAITKTDDVTGILSYSEADGVGFFVIFFSSFLFVFSFLIVRQKLRIFQQSNCCGLNVRTSSKVGNETRSFFRMLQNKTRGVTRH